MPAIGSAVAVEGGSLAERVRIAHDRFNDVCVEMAEGYSPTPL